MSSALIWGASGGMGQALIEHLSAQEWTTYAAARHSSRIPTIADNIYEFQANDEHSIQQVVLQVAQQAGEVDLMVYAAGTLTYEKIGDMSLDGWLNTLHSNLTGAFLVAKHGLPLLANNGHMVFIGAYVDHLRLPKMGAYAAAKAGLEELVTILSKENRRQRFTIVHPGAVNTPFWENVTFKMPADAKSPTQVAQDILQYHLSGKMGILNL